MKSNGPKNPKNPVIGTTEDGKNPKNPVIGTTEDGKDVLLFRGRVNLDRTDLRPDPDQISTTSGPGYNSAIPITKSAAEIDRMHRYNVMMGRHQGMGYVFSD